MTRAPVAPLLFGAALVLLPWSVVRVFLDTPIERQMGTAQKIFYFHLPMAWICMAFAVVCGIAAVVELRRRSVVAGAVAVASAEMVLIAGLGMLISGPIWGHATWGRAWTWDARQVSAALLWLIFASYVLVRRYGAAGSERLAAALAIFGAAEVPVIYYAVKVWKTTHPTTDVVGSLPPSFWAALWPALCALSALSLGLVLVRVRLELLAQQLERQADS